MDPNNQTSLKIRINKDKKLVIKQIIVYDQFSTIFQELIKIYNTSDHICGYAVTANIRIIKEFGIEKGLEKLQNVELVKQYMGDMMKSIFLSRMSYGQQQWGKDFQKITNYCKDWIANYELSDYMKTLALEDVYIFRHVGLYHKELFEKTENQERERIIKDETPFKDQPYFIYYPKEDKYINKNQFKIEDNHLYIFDTMGHFVCGWVKNKSKNNKEITILETISHLDTKSNQNFQIFFK